LFQKIGHRATPEKYEGVGTKSLSLIKMSFLGVGTEKMVKPEILTHADTEAVIG
jgi:hypothetical protein